MKRRYIFMLIVTLIVTFILPVPVTAQTNVPITADNNVIANLVILGGLAVAAFVLMKVGDKYK